MVAAVGKGHVCLVQDTGVSLVVFGVLIFRTVTEVGTWEM